MTITGAQSSIHQSSNPGYFCMYLRCSVDSHSNYVPQFYSLSGGNLHQQLENSKYQLPTPTSCVPGWSLFCRYFATPFSHI